jgi:hypothetical protein
LRDLFPKPLAGDGREGGSQRSHARIPASDVLILLHHEITQAVLILYPVLQQRSISEEDWDRLGKAYVRISRARDMTCPATMNPPGEPQTIHRFCAD